MTTTEVIYVNEVGCLGGLIFGVVPDVADLDVVIRVQGFSNL